MKLINNEEKYWEFIRKLRNDARTGFVEKHTILSDHQKEYMKKHNDSYKICVVENNIPVGFIGDVDLDLRLAVREEYRNQGIGKFMLVEYMKIRPEANAKILHNNIASIKTFESCGFVKVGGDCEFYYYELQK